MRTDGDVALLLGSGEKETGLFVFWGWGWRWWPDRQSQHKSSPPHSQSLAWLSETAAGGSASGVRSGPAAVRSPDTPEEEDIRVRTNKTDLVLSDKQI